jgi:hypothetical protein
MGWSGHHGACRVGHRATCGDGGDLGGAGDYL